MDCLYCGEKLSALSSKDRQFCNKKHQELWREQEAQLSIQRLKEAFGFAASPSSKPRQTSTSLLDPPNYEIPPAPEFTTGNQYPTTPEFNYQEAPRDIVTEAPADNPNVIYAGPVSDRNTPPNAGFVSGDAPKGTFRLASFIRRPEFGEMGAGAAVVNLVPQRAVEFPAIPCFTEVDICTVGQPGHSAPQPSPDLHFTEQLRKPVEDQLRGLAFQLSSAPGTAVDVPGVETYPEVAQRTATQNAEILQAEQVFNVQPMALRTREPEIRESIPAGLAILPAKLPHPATELDGVPFQIPTLGALPVPCGRVGAVPLSRTFQALASQRRTAAWREELAAAADAALQSAKSVPSVELPLRLRESEPPAPRAAAIQVQASAWREKLAAAALQPSKNIPEIQLALRMRGFEPPAPRLATIRTQGFGARAGQLQDRACLAAQKAYDARPVALQRRESSSRSVVAAQNPRVNFANMTSAAAQVQPQPVIGSRTLRALAIPSLRETPVPVQSDFQTLAATQAISAPRTNVASIPCPDLPHHKLRPKLRIAPRDFAEPAIQSFKVPGILTAVQAFALRSEKPEENAGTTLQPVPEIRPPAGELRAKIARREIPQRPPVAARRSQVIPASLPASGARQSPSSAVTQRIVSTRERVRQVAPRELELQYCKAPSALMGTRAVAASVEQRPRDASCLTDAIQAPVCEVRLNVAGRSGATLPAAFARSSRTIAAALPRSPGRPQELARSDASPTLTVALDRLNAPLPNSSFLGVATEERTPKRRTNRATQPTADLPSRELRAQPVQVGPRGLPLRGCEWLPSQLSAQASAPSFEKLERRKCAASDQAVEARPMALRLREQEHQALAAEYRGPVLLQLQRAAASRPLVPDYRNIEMQKLAIAMRQAVPVSCPASFEALPKSAPAMRHKGTIATRLSPSADIDLCVEGRIPHFLPQTSISRQHTADLESQPCHVPEFLVSASKRRTICPSRPLPSWDPEWLGPDQYVQWSPWLGSYAPPDRAAAALATGSSTARLIRMAAWTEASETLSQSALSLQLPRREADAVLVQIRPAAPPPAPAERAARTATRTLAVSGAPAGKKQGIRWVAHKVPWVPMP